jgi:peptidoglycan/LPS O-acetylase OafA/YrhL
MRSEIRSLTGLRGLAALWVMTGHYIRDTPHDPTVRFVINHMYIAVDLFMVLSGFVLAMSYNADFEAAPNGGRMWRFVLLRIARIWPVYALSCAVCVGLVVTGIGVWGPPDISPLAVALNLGMVQTWIAGHGSLNAVGWSISTEWAASLLFPVFGLLLMRPSLRLSTIAAVGALAVLVVYDAVGGQAGPDAPPVFGALTWYSYPGALVRCLTEFMFGMFCWRLRRDAGWTSWLGTSAVLLPAIVAMAAMTLDRAMDLTFVLLACVTIIGFSHERSAVAAAFASPVPRWLGTISFSLYLWHIPLLRLEPTMETVTGSLGAPDPWLAGNLVTMAIVLGMSALSFRWIEKPAQRAFRHAFGV